MPDNVWLLAWLQSPFGYAVSGLWGALFGSFANVCIYRIPLHQSIATPRSFCPSCKHPIAAYDNIPIASYVLRKGRCRYCNAKIPIRYPIIELLMLGFSLVLFARFVVHGHGTVVSMLTAYLVSFGFTLVLLILSAIDLEHFLLPNVLTYPAIVVFFLLGQLTHFCSLYSGLLGAGLGYLLIRLLSDGYRLLKKQEGIGYGDGKLLAIVGGLLGVQGMSITLLLGSVLGSLLGIPWLLWSGKKDHTDTPVWKRALPFGPFLSFAAFLYLVLVWGKPILSELQVVENLF